MNGESLINVRRPEPPGTRFYGLHVDKGFILLVLIRHYKYKHIFYKYDSAIKKNILIMNLLSEYFVNNEIIIIFAVSK